jgi:dihydropteroate synthase
MTKRIDKMTFSGFTLDFTRRCAVMGILNVTGDSFSDGGLYNDTASAVARGIEMAAMGADIIDIGPESSRPGSKRLSANEQISRAIPVIERLAAEVDIPLSIDTYDPAVARAAIEAGASIINDITAGGRKGMFELAAEKQSPIILMHMQGTPETMQQKPSYDNVVNEVYDFLLSRAHLAVERGVKKEHIIIDPGVGFGKTIEHNLQLLRNLDKFTSSGYAVLLGASRKGFIGQITGREKPSERAAGTVATTLKAYYAGVQIIRVHDIAENIDALKIAACIENKDLTQ